MMRSFKLTVALALGCAILGCGGAPKPAVAPADSAEAEATEPRAEESEAEESSVGEGSASESQPSSDEASETPEATPPPPSSTDAEGQGSEAVTEETEPGAGQCRDNTGPLALAVDRKFVDLKKGSLEAQMDGHICNISLTIERNGGLPTVTKHFRYIGPKRELRWSPIPRDEIAKIEVRIESDDGGYESVFLVPWFVAIDHEEVVFDTNQAIIRESEVPSLEDSLEKIKQVLAEGEDKGLGTITLFIAGHTDTRGSDQHNMVLSQNRARAIASWFMKAGLCIPIAFQGFGESALKKLTADEVDEQENRRVDYILSVEPPVIREGAPAAWQWLSKGC